MKRVCPWRYGDELLNADWIGTMLKAVLEGKAGRVSVDGEERLSWRDVFRKREDLLTAVIFGRLTYLSETAQERILANLVDVEAAGLLGQINEIVFWPQLQGLHGRRYVEPDILMIFDNAMLLIEVKPPFGGDQYESQWRNEIASLLLQKETENSDWEVPEHAYFLSLGRNMENWSEIAGRLKEEFSDDGLKGVFIREWDELSHKIIKMHEEEEDSRNRAILYDWIEAFELFGIAEKPRPFDEIVNTKLTVSGDWRKLFEQISMPTEEQTTITIDWQSLNKFANQQELRIQSWE